MTAKTTTTGMPEYAATTVGGTALPAKQPKPPLTPAQLREALALNSPELVGAIYEMVQRQVTIEAGRQTRLDAKATSLLTSAGLSLTVMLSFCGLLFSTEGVKAFKDDMLKVPAMVLFLGAIFLGLWAAIQALRALRVTGYLSMGEGTIFDREVLEDANKTADKYKGEHGLMEYRKYLIPDLWKIAQKQEANHERKAGIIALGQGLFIAFLVDLCLLALVLMVAVVFAKSGG